MDWGSHVRFSIALSACGGRASGPAVGLDGGSADDASASSRDSGSPFDAGPRPDAEAIPTDCVDDARWIYLFDSDRHLVRFRPDDLSFTTVGSVGCSADSEPFSMSVDRRARAWVLFDDGSLSVVSTEDASCMPTTFARTQHGFAVFGMGFVTRGEGAYVEDLYVAGGYQFEVAKNQADFGRIDTSSLNLSEIAPLPGWPELTGTGSGQLWGFFPNIDPPAVMRLDKATGAPLETFDVGALNIRRPMAWAFAFWGARFYIFLQDEHAPSTSVWLFDPADGSVVELLHEIGTVIVGAGVSTCAPTDLI
jgi:hypothetical protein